MDRYWLLTSTFYGNWLPGDPRGFVSRVRDSRPGDPPRAVRQEHDAPRTPYDAGFAGLHRSAASRTVAVARLDASRATALLGRFGETARVRNWSLLAAAVMADHVHLVVGVPGDPDPGKVLGDLKAYGSRTLTERFGRPPGGRWWTHRGSTRKLPDEAAVRAAVRYVCNQRDPLAVWAADDWRDESAAGSPEGERSP